MYKRRENYENNLNEHEGREKFNDTNGRRKENVAWARQLRREKEDGVKKKGEEMLITTFTAFNLNFWERKFIHYGICE